MRNRRKRKPPRKIRRNPFAKALAGGKFRVRVVKDIGAYRRRAKHRRPAGEAD
jgi:hypothetical protein